MKITGFFILSHSRFDVKWYFWCDNRINFKAHLNWISVGAKKCLAFFSHSNPILNYGQPTVEQMIWLICSFFSFARCVEFIFWLAYEFAKCLQHSLFSALIFWTIFFFFWLLLNLFFVFSKDLYQRSNGQRRRTDDDLLLGIDLSGLNDPDSLHATHKNPVYMYKQAKQILQYSFNPLYQNSSQLTERLNHITHRDNIVDDDT